MAPHRRYYPVQCDGVSRRDFLKIGVLGVAGLTLPDFLELEAAEDRPAGKAKAAIVLWMGGGPSHIDTWDPKPEAPSEWRGEFNAIPTAVDGLRICEHLPRVARVAQHLNILRSVTHPEGAHERGTSYLLTGYQVIPGFEYPGYGSIVAKLQGWQNNMPPYVAVPSMIGDAGPGYLGAEGSPFGAGDPGNPNYSVRDITLPGGVDLARLERRRQFLAAADTLTRTGRVEDPVTSLDRFYARAYDMITSPATRKAFDLKEEDPKLRDAYGRNTLGQGCLLARRLIEAGVRFVTVARGGWDNHGNIFPALRNERLPEVDQALSTLIRDLKDRGLLDEVLVLWMGEFGRTPRVNNTAGRDHWPKAQSVVMAGGGLRGGIVVGATNDKGEEPVERPIKPEEIACTLFTQLGINPNRVFNTPSGRPIRVAQGGEPIRELL